MKKYWEAIKKDFWVVILDIVAVNIAFLGALLLRFHSLMSQTTKKALNFA